MGRRLTEHDRNWSIFVGRAGQCKKAPVSGTDLCETCGKHETNGTAVGHWQGRVTSLESLPADSHIAGSEWFHKNLDNGKLVWRGVEKPRTARDEGGGGKAPKTADLALAKFVRGEIGHTYLNIEELSARRRISAQQLRDMICQLHGEPTGVTDLPQFGTKSAMCEEIRRLMMPGATMSALKVPQKKTQMPASDALHAANQQLAAALQVANMRIQALEAKLAAAAAALV
jgi:hypothetical protein